MKDKPQPAFPIHFNHGAAGVECSSGMILRDYFACHATDDDVAPYLNDYDKLIDRPAPLHLSANSVSTKAPTPVPKHIARYKFADKMMEARKNG